MNEILNARERRYHLIQTKDFSKYQVIVIKANIPGAKKNIKEAYILINIFKNIVADMINLVDITYIDESDGPYYLLTINHQNDLKLKLIDIENNHQLGRLIDLDLFINANHSISRNDLGINRRKCLICERDAILCNREQKHSYIDIIKEIENKVQFYLENTLNQKLKDAIYLELNLDLKFGLVTPTSSGSHDDMNYHLMAKSIDAILPYLVKMAMVGYHKELKDAYEEAIIIGIEAEKAMLAVTNNINTYKGLIYILGLASLSIGHALGNKQEFDQVFTNIKTISKDIFNKQINNSFGKYAYLEYGFTGARGEAYSGLSTVASLVEFFEENDITPSSLHMGLIKAIDISNDSVLLKRSGSMKKYQYYKDLIISIKEYNIEKIKMVTKECIDNNISCGGSADILITALFIYNCKKIFW
jgi:holo-ACP synthase CitX